MRRVYVDLLWAGSMALNAGVLVFDLWNGAYHIAAGVSVVLFLLGVGRHVIGQFDRRVALLLDRMETDKQTAAAVLAQVSRADTQVVIDAPDGRIKTH